MTALLAIRGLSKRFTLHQRGGVALDVLRDFSLDLRAGECVAITGPSGTGKSTVLKCIHRTYRPTAGMITFTPAPGQSIDLATADDRAVLHARRHWIGCATQFLRVIPRVSALDLVAEPMLETAAPDDVDARAAARRAAARLLARLDLGTHLHALPPATFSGGEQQRVNLARTFAVPRPLLLLDEPTASLDAGNAERVIGLAREALDRGAAILAVFHDPQVRARLASRVVTVATET